jgi:hypothetical protein
MSNVIDLKRLEAVKDIKSTIGGHSAPGPDEAPGAFCAMERFAYITGQAWTDHPANCSLVVGAFIRRWNDGTDQDTRDRLDKWIVDNADRLTQTAGDGLDKARGYLAADYAMRTVMPIWLDVAGATDAAQAVRELAPIVDRDTAYASTATTRPLRDDLISRRDKALDGLWEKVRAAVEEKLKEKGPASAAQTAEAAGAAWAAEAAGAAWAAWAAEAAWASWASWAAEAAGAAWTSWAAWAAEAAGAAWAAEAAEAAWAAWAAEAAADLLPGKPGYYEVYRAVKAKLRPIFAEKITAAVNEKFGPRADELKAGGFAALEAMLVIANAQETELAA